MSRPLRGLIPRAALPACCLALAAALCAACFDLSGYHLLIVLGEEDAGADDGPVGLCVPPTPNGACGTYPQCGCAEGEACDVVGENGRSACVPDKGLPPGAACGGLFLGCSAGLTCVNGACKRFCKSPQSCEAEGLCFPVVYEADAGGMGVPGMRVCTDQCDYMNPSASCGAGIGCYPHDDVNTIYSECKPAGPSTSDCAVNEDCAAGLGCGEDKRCHPWCRYGVPADCPPPQFCIAVKGGKFPVFYYLGDVAYGVCK